MSARRTPVREASLAGVLLLGYLVALTGTSVGQGWALLGHVATEHRAPLAAPGIQPELPAGTERLTTLRPLAPEARHSHGGRAHTHSGARSAHPDAYRTVRVRAPEASGVDTVADGFHAHGDELHRHDAPPADPAPVVLALDKHRLPLAPVLAPPPVRAVTWAARTGGLASAEMRVETPPPRARG